MKKQITLTILLLASLGVMGQSKIKADTLKQSKYQMQTRIETLMKLIYDVRYPGNMPKNKKSEMLRVADSLLKADIGWHNKVQ